MERDGAEGEGRGRKDEFEKPNTKLDAQRESPRKLIAARDPAPFDEKNTISTHTFVVCKK